jgi:hypothetical protein
MTGHLLSYPDPDLEGILAGNQGLDRYGDLDPDLIPFRAGNPVGDLGRIPVRYPVGVLVGIISPAEGPYQAQHLPGNQGGVQVGLEVSAEPTPATTSRRWRTDLSFA